MKQVPLPPDRTLDSFDPLSTPIHSLVWGYPGCGKTVFGATFPRPHILNMDADTGDSVAWAVKEGIVPHDPSEIRYADIYEGITAEERGEYGFIKKPIALDRMQAKVNLWQNDGTLSGPESTLILDSATKTNEMMLRHGIQGYDTIGRSESWKSSLKMQVLVRAIQDYNPAKAYFLQFVEWTRTLGCNVVILAHCYMDENKSGHLIGLLPLLLGSLRQEIPGQFQEVYYMEAGVTGKPEVPCRILHTEPHKKVKVAKSRMGFLPATVINPTYAKIARARELYYSGAEQDKIEAILSADPRTVRL
jgi:hypothetical protein